MSQQYIIFKLCDKKFGVNIRYVLEIIAPQEVFKTPNTPKYIEGLINLRGKVFTLINLREKFDFCSDDMDKSDMKFLIVNTNLISAGFIVDEVEDIEIIEDNNIISVSELNTDFNKEYLYGVAKIDDKEIFLLEPESFMENLKIGIA